MDNPVITPSPGYRNIADRLLYELPDVHDRFIFLCIAQACKYNDNRGVQLATIVTKAKAGWKDTSNWVEPSIESLTRTRPPLIQLIEDGTHAGLIRLSESIYKELTGMWDEFEKVLKHDHILGIGPWDEKDTRILAP